MGKKIRGMNAGTYSGYGGYAFAGESFREAAVRITKEETGIVVSDAKQVGTVFYGYANDLICKELHVFKGTEFTGKVGRGRARSHEWFPVSDLPYSLMLHVFKGTE